MMPFAACALLPLLAPVGEWPSFRGDPGQRGVADCELSRDLALVWSFDVGAAVTSSPVVADGRVFVGADDGALHALELDTGRELWSFMTEDVIEAPPLVHGGLVVVGSSDFHVYAVDAETGKERWRFQTEDRVLGGASAVPHPSGEGFRVVVGSYDGALYCLESVDGAQAWKYQTDNYVNGTPAVLDERVVFGGCDAVLHVVSSATGEALSTVPLGESCHVAGSVGLADGRAYFGHYGNAFVCVDLESGETYWQVTDPSNAFFSAPAIGDERVVFGGRNKEVICVDRETGARLWSKKTRRKVDSSPVIAQDAVVAASGDGRVYVFALEDGEERWSYEIGRPVFSSPAVVDGRIVIGANDGRVYCFGPATQESVGRGDG